jgi:hypothetical protein
MRLRQLYLWHRYLGITLCVMCALWFVSGVVMLYVRMPILFPQERFSYLPPFDPAGVAITPEDAVARSGLTETPRRLRIASLLDRPIYYVLPRGRPWMGVYADNGELLNGISPETARHIASRAHPGFAAYYVRTVETIDQWTLTNSLNLHRPLHRIALDDGQGTEVYVSSQTARSSCARRVEIARWPGSDRSSTGARQKHCARVSHSGVSRFCGSHSGQSCSRSPGFRSA